MKSSILAILAMALTVLLPAAHPAVAQTSGVTSADDRVGQIFSDLEKRIIREVLAETGLTDDESDESGEDDDDRRKTGKAGKGAGKGGKSGLPPGLAKRDSLPPGLQKQLDRNGRLPPGLDRRALPEDLEKRLPARTDTERVIVDNDVVLIEKGTDLVLDVIRDVVRDKTGTPRQP
jgi:hypothetical protein